MRKLLIAFFGPFVFVSAMAAQGPPAPCYLTQHQQDQFRSSTYGDAEVTAYGVCGPACSTQRPIYDVSLTARAEHRCQEPEYASVGTSVSGAPARTLIGAGIVKGQRTGNESQHSYYYNDCVIGSWYEIYNHGCLDCEFAAPKPTNCHDGPAARAECERDFSCSLACQTQGSFRFRSWIRSGCTPPGACRVDMYAYKFTMESHSDCTSGGVVTISSSAIVGCDVEASGLGSTSAPCPSGIGDEEISN